jgi:transglutaminase/protease-like cytokinesis protein 3
VLCRIKDIDFQHFSTFDFLWNGYAFGEYDKFDSHAWNMIYVDGNWIYVDPTWNLSSGVVSSSHIYIKDNRKEELLLQFKGTGTDIKIERDFAIKEL